MTVDRTKVAVLVCPLIPYSHTMLLKVMHVGVATQKPQQLVDDRLEVELLGGEQGEAVSKIEAHLIAEHAHRARSRAVCLCGTLGKDAVKERKILLHDIVMYTFFLFCYTDCVRTAGASSGTCELFMRHSCG